ncbi:hypothetical protein H9Q10_10995 [Eikenella sp. S3360]|uniref:Uncharacterized protein n=1 Tax=Eikenella glucosivorans TaxID=2766967 RepID=A0ABS0ND68_9NEIS|nr:hypothetical protein [Eikenella glucosivorans]MBH5330189.1 hypothetical protein [Eikenella glucosivorans]
MSNEIKKLPLRDEPAGRHDTELVLRQMGLLSALTLGWLLFACSWLTGEADTALRLQQISGLLLTGFFLGRCWRGLRKIRYRAEEDCLSVYAVSLRGWRLAGHYPLADFAGLYRGGEGTIAEVWLAGKNGGQDVLLDRIFLGTGALRKRFAACLAELSRATGLPVRER